MVAAAVAINDARVLHAPRRARVCVIEFRIAIRRFLLVFRCNYAEF